MVTVPVQTDPNPPQIPRDTTIGDPGLGSNDYVGAADGGDRGYVWNGTHRKLTYSNASWSGMFGTRGTHLKD